VFLLDLVSVMLEAAEITQAGQLDPVGASTPQVGPIAASPPGAGSMPVR
jgi:hypothetical protein